MTGIQVLALQLLLAIQGKLSDKTRFLFCIELKSKLYATLHLSLVASEDMVSWTEHTRQAFASCIPKLTTQDVLSCHQIRITADFCDNDNVNSFEFGNTTYTFKQRIPPHSCSYFSNVGPALLTPNCNGTTCR